MQKQSMIRWLLAGAALGFLAPASGRADVVYTFFDKTTPTQVDLSFTVTSQLKTNGQTEPMMDVGGVFASDFTGRSMGYGQGAPGHQPTFSATGTPATIRFEATFTGFPFGDPSNGAPGNGAFPVDGNIHQIIFVPPFSVTLADLGSATISGVGVVVPEPGFAGIVSVGLAAVLFAARKRKTQ
jgi:hypothetical protein